jgi:RNA polymerase sigma-70 factor (ECF subfamily)
VKENRLVARARNGDARAERELYDAHVDRVYRLAYRMTGREDLAEEFTQDAFVRAFDRLDDFRGEAAFSTWLHSVATSVIYNGLRKIERLRERETALEDAGPLGRAPGAPNPGLKRALHRAIDGLPDHERMVFVMHEIEGYTHREIAGALDVAVGTSKGRLSRARDRLQGELAPYAPEWASCS